MYDADAANGHNFGFTVGQQYTLRWPSNPNTTNFNNVCAGDSTNQWVTKADGQGNEQRGYIQFTDASSIAKAIEGDHIDYPVSLDSLLNNSVDPTNGAKSAEQNAIGVRIAQDGDTTSTTYDNYIASAGHNGRPAGDGSGAVRLSGRLRRSSAHEPASRRGGLRPIPAVAHITIRPVG